MKILLKYAGKDATEEYLPIHPKGTIEEALAPEQHLGEVDMSTVVKVVVEEVKAPTGAPPATIGGCLNIADIEVSLLRYPLSSARADRPSIGCC